MGSGASLDQVLPMAATMGLAEAVRGVAATGASQHVRADVLVTPRGAASLLVSIYRLPDGSVLLLAEQAWQARRPGNDTGVPPRRRPAR